MGNLLKALNPRGYTTEMDYTPTYRPAQVTDPEGHAISYAYDADGNRISRTSALGISTRFEYDALGRRIAVTRNADSGSPADHQTNVRTEYGYDLAGNPVNQGQTPIKKNNDFNLPKYHGVRMTFSRNSVDYYLLESKSDELAFLCNKKF